MFSPAYFRMLPAPRPPQVCLSVRAICLAPAAVADLALSVAAKEFVISVVNGRFLYKSSLVILPFC